MNPCDKDFPWQGISCSQPCLQTNCHITGINLRAYSLIGPLPAEMFPLLPQLSVLNLMANRLTSSLPNTLYNATVLNELVLSWNSFSGSIATNIDQLKHLTKLDLSGNGMISSIPSSVGSLNNLQSLLLTSNYLTSIIPYSIGLLLELTQLDVSSNSLISSIPVSFYDLTKLQLFSVKNNQVSGCLQDKLVEMHALVQLNLDYNLFSCSIPVRLGNLSHLIEFSIQENQFTGEIPHDIGNATALVNLYLNKNSLTGTIPTSMGNLLNVQNLYLYDNALRGSIPTTFEQLSVVRYLDLHSNMLTGALPDFSNFKYMNTFNMYSNKLSGSVQSSIGFMTRCVYLDLSFNSFTGSLPQDLERLASIEYMYLQSNRFTGTLPQLGNLTRLGTLLLYENGLTGTIPSLLHNLCLLRELSLSRNHFTGSLNDLFGDISISSTDKLIEVIDVSDNRISGTIPEAMFALSRLKTAALGLNCFTGSIPENVCNCSSMSILYLDGAGAANFCQSSIKMPLLGVTLFNTLKGSIPECLWSLGNLTSLHLAGTGMTGTLGSIPHSSPLVDLHLEHNHLSGIIPESIQQKHFANLSMQYNRISGTVDRLLQKHTSNQEFDISSSINLEVNRLSGHSSPYTLYVGYLNILHGNTFSCQNLPENDENVNKYSCESMSLNNAYFFAMGAFGVVLILCGFVWLVHYMKQRQRPRGCYDSCETSFFSALSRICHFIILRCRWVYFLYHFFDEQNDVISTEDLCFPSGIRNLIQEFQRVSKMVSSSAILIVLVSLPLYIIKLRDVGVENRMISTQTYTYWWVSTLAYSSGNLSAALLLCSWAVAIAVLYVSMKLNRHRFITSSVELTNVKDSTSSKSQSSYVAVFIVVAVDVVVVCTVNGFYVYMSLQLLSDRISTLLHLSMAVFNVLWNVTFMNTALKQISSVSTRSYLKLLLGIFNWTLLPCVVVALTSESCYKGIFIANDSIETYYSYNMCVNVGGGPFSACEGSIVTTTYLSVVPPYSYNYACASELIVDYVPVYIYSYSMLLLSFIVIPMIFVTSQHNDDVSVFWFFERIVGGIIWPNRWLRSDIASSYTSPAGSNNFKNESQNLFVPSSHVLYRPFGVLTEAVKHFAILLTFGLTSPALAIAVACTVYQQFAVHRIFLARFICRRGGVDKDLYWNEVEKLGIGGNLHTVSLVKKIVDNNNVDKAIHALNDTGNDVGLVMESCPWLLIWASAVFVAIVSFDFAGDVHGLVGAIWAPIATISLVILLHILDYFIRENEKSRRFRQNDSVREMRRRSDSHDSRNPIVEVMQFRI
eukprot:CAMPEP_0185021922 /NCGR_PEP_ID=MMETSP1103-20130426/4621_1 /TAXON_ID=36769 /ORGANISM="Paraphysomonas bandaiensis, Strain Caron Lab Isolate" /LENGTH=1297 /DNA_ID=CAMNT_0027553721 /DNA_START=274 /DNA_END=4167 /DNA_ORIENTATION=+